MGNVFWTSLDVLVPVFPLPNLVMFPRAVQFVHIFEPRYRCMIKDMLGRPDAKRWLAMALLQPNYEEKYYTNHAEIHSILCLCEVVRHEKLDDGRYNLLIQGRARARVCREDRDGDYRRAELEVLPAAAPIDEPERADARRSTIREMLNRPPFDTLPGRSKYAQWLDSDLALGDVTDLLCSYLLPAEDCELRQSLLCETDSLQRADLLLGHLDTIGRVLLVQRQRYRHWPPDLGLN